MYRETRLLYSWRAVSPALLLFAIWSCGSLVLGNSRLPGPLHSVRLMFSTAFGDSIIAAQGGGSWGYAPHILSTFWHVALGAVGGICAGVIIALVASQRRTSRVITNTILEVTRALPPLIFVPFAAIALGASNLVQILSVAVYSALIIAVYALNAIEHIQPSYLQLAHLLGARVFRRIVTVLLPAILPELVGPIRLVFALGLGISIVAEYLVSPDGIGRVMKYAMAFSSVELIMVGVLWTVVLAFVFDGIVVLVFGALLTWTERRQLLEWISR